MKLFRSASSFCALVAAGLSGVTGTSIATPLTVTLMGGSSALKVVVVLFDVALIVFGSAEADRLVMLVVALMAAARAGALGVKVPRL